MVAVLVPPEILAKANEDAMRHHALKTHRPTSLAMVLSNEGKKKGRLLLVRSKRSMRWKFPGGGVEQNEDVLSAALRELREEVGIWPQDLIDVWAHCLTGSVDSYRLPRDGFTMGKRYYFWLMRCHTIPDIVMQRTEVIDYKWCAPQLAEEFFINLRQPGKNQRLILTALSVMRNMQSRIS